MVAAFCKLILLLKQSFKVYSVYVQAQESQTEC